MAISWYNFGTNLVRKAAGFEAKHGGYILPEGGALKRTASLVFSPLVLGYNAAATLVSPAVWGGRATYNLVKSHPVASALIGVPAALGAGYAMFGGNGDKAADFTPAVKGGEQALNETQMAQEQAAQQAMLQQQMMQAQQPQPVTYQMQDPMTASVAGQTQPVNYLQAEDPGFKVLGAGREVHGKMMAQQATGIAQA